MTESQIQDAITALYESSSTSPGSTDDDYLTRRLLMNRALHRWERVPGYWWNSLWAQDTSKTVLAATTSYAAPTNFRRAGGWIRIIDANGNTIKKYPVLKAPDAQSKSDTEAYAYFSGDPISGYNLHINPSPVATDAIIGCTIKYDYYKKATEYTATTTISEIPDTEYIIHSVVAELFKSDRNMNAYTTSLQEAEERLKGMQVAHMAEIDWQDNTIPDETSYGFGV